MPVTFNEVADAKLNTPKGKVSMTAITDAHRYLERFCHFDSLSDPEPGIAIGAEVFTHLVRSAIDLANSRPITLPTTNMFQRMKLTFSGVIDPSQMVVNLDKRAAPAGGWPDPAVSIQDLTFKISIFLDAMLMSVHRVQYLNISGSIAVTVERIVLVGEECDGEWRTESDPWRGMTNLPDGTEFTAELKAAWEVQEKAVELVAKDLLGPALLQSVELPNVIKMLTSISFVGPVRVGGEVGLIMFSGPAKWEMDCPRTRATMPASSVKITNALTGSLPEEGIGGTLDSADPNSHYPRRGDDGPGHLRNADVFVHLPKPFVQKRFEGVTKPAVGFNDDGHFGPIYWHYESAIIVQSLDLTMTNLWPLEFRIDLPSKGVGVAGAGIKIGCVYVEAAGLAFNGNIDPFEIFFKIGQDVQSSELYFESRFGTVNANGFQFHHWPVSKFPMDQIADFILARVAEMLMSRKTGDLLNVTRFSLVQYALLKGFGKMLPGMAAERSDSAVTVGVTFQK